MYDQELSDTKLLKARNKIQKKMNRYLHPKHTRHWLVVLIFIVSLSDKPYHNPEFDHSSSGGAERNQGYFQKCLALNRVGFRSISHDQPFVVSEPIPIS
jgi:hypothetical protein